MLGLFAGCQQVPEVFEQPKDQKETQPDKELADDSKPSICYFPEYCYQISFPDKKPLRISHPTLKGKVFVGFLVDGDLQITREYV